MNSLKILITNHALVFRAGTELYVRDLALSLKQRGHSPFVYSPVLGDVAEEIQGAGIPVVDDLNALSTAPDIIHGQHHLPTMMSLFHFPRVPAVYFCHGWIPWEETPPRFPRILRYVAVDETRRDYLRRDHGIPGERIQIFFNFVDLERFRSRRPLPARPKRALFFSNYVRKESPAFKIIQKACARCGISLDAVGYGVNQLCREPERVLGDYDLVFAKGRCALEALAVGDAVIVCDTKKIGPMVRRENLEELRSFNFALQARQEPPIHADAVAREMDGYDPREAHQVSKIIRETASLEKATDQIGHLYKEVLGEWAQSPEGNGFGEREATARYLRFLSPRLRDYSRLQYQVGFLEQEAKKLKKLRRLYQTFARLPLLGPCLTRIKEGWFETE